MAATETVLSAGRRGRLERLDAARRGPDRLTLVLLTLAAFLVVLALLASHLRPTAAPASAHPVVVLRKIYRTRVIASAPGSGPAASSITQSVSSSGSSLAAAATPTTRTS